MIIASEKHKYMIYLSPKCGCTLVRDVFVKTHRDEFPSANKHNIHNLYTIKKGEEKDYDRYMIYRNPYSRILSLYFDKVVRYYSDIPHPMKMESIPKHFGDNCPNFIEFLDAMIGLKEASKTEHINHHFTDQVSSFDKWLPPNHLYSIKKYDELCKVIAKRLPADKALIMLQPHTRQNVSKYKDYQQDMSRKNILTEYEIDRTCPVMRNMMNPETQKLIEAIYERDFEYFSAVCIYPCLNRER